MDCERFTAARSRCKWYHKSVRDLIHWWGLLESCRLYPCAGRLYLCSRNAATGSRSPTLLPQISVQAINIKCLQFHFTLMCQLVNCSDWELWFVPPITFNCGSWWHHSWEECAFCHCPLIWQRWRLRPFWTTACRSWNSCLLYGPSRVMCIQLIWFQSLLFPICI